MWLTLWFYWAAGEQKAQATHDKLARRGVKTKLPLFPASEAWGVLPQHNWARTDWSSCSAGLPSSYFVKRAPISPRAGICWSKCFPFCGPLAAGARSHVTKFWLVRHKQESPGVFCKKGLLSLKGDSHGYCYSSFSFPLQCGFDIWSFWLWDNKQ